MDVFTLLVLCQTFYYVCGQGEATATSFSIGVVAPVDPKASVAFNKIPGKIDMTGAVSSMEQTPSEIKLESLKKDSLDFIADNSKLSAEGDIPTATISDASKGKENLTDTGTLRDSIAQLKKMKSSKRPSKSKVMIHQKTFPPSDEADKATPIELGAEESSKEEDELGSAFESDEEDLNKVEGKKKPCQKQCESANDEEGEKKKEPLPPEPDVPIELGSTFTDDDEDNSENMDEKETVTYLPFLTPGHFIMVDTEKKSDEDGGDVSSGETSGSGSGIEDTNYKNFDTSEDEGSTGSDRTERSLNENQSNLQEVNSTSITANTDGNYDGELLQTYYNHNGVEDYNESIGQSRKRRAVEAKQKRKVVINKSKKRRTKENKFKTSRRRKHPKHMKKHARWLEQSHATKRSDIEADRELLKTIENLNSMAASKRDVPGLTDKKPLKGYMKNLAHDVRSVLNQAKSALKDTGRVIHGLRRVISGADVLTSFTSNAVKFAKYYSLEPSNATVDYLEEKAIVSVLEAQRAASEAKEAAKLAKLAYSKTQEVEKKMEIAAHNHKKVKGTLKYVKMAGRQAARASKAADLASRFKEKTEKDVMLMDQELRKMGAQLAEQNNGENIIQKNATNSPTTSEKAKSFHNQTKVKEETLSEPVTENSFEDQQIAPDVQLLLPKMQKENEGKISVEKTNEHSAIAVEDEKDATLNKEPKSYAYYFQMKQKQLEKQLTNVTSTNAVVKDKETSSPKHTARKYALPGRKHVMHTLPGERAVKVIDTIPLAEAETVKHPDDQIEVEYIASLNKKIAEIKKEEEEATQRLKAVELARTFAATKDKNKDEFTPSKVTEENAIERNLASEISSLKEPSILKTQVPVATDQYVSLGHNAPTHENKVSNNANVIKKQTIHKHNFKKPMVHLFPGQFTGFKKHEIPSKKFTVNDKSPSAVSENEIEDAISDDENTVVTEDFDAKRKRERVAADEKFFDEANDENFNDVSGSGDSESGEAEDEKSEVSLLRGPVSVTVKVNNKKTNKRSNTFSKTEDLIDPFGFNRIANTNEGEIVDRTEIPKPEYLVPNFKRSEVPKPSSQTLYRFNQVEVINDGKK